MNIINSKHLFYVCAGLTASDGDGYDHADADVARLADGIRSAGFSEDVKTWFSRARTGQVAVNPYWPRGSCLASACFFIDERFLFEIEAFFAFLEGAGAVSDPVGADDFKMWIAGLPEALRSMDSHPASAALWREHCRIVEARSSEWRGMLEKAARAAKGFFGDDAPEMAFCPNLFTPYSADFVRKGNRIITISSAPDAETMLHETMHPIVAQSRPEIAAFAEKHGVGAFADKEKMMELGYMADGSAASAAHAIEECFVRALSVVLAGGGDERLCSHAEYGCTSVPFIASRLSKMNLPAATLGELIADVLGDMGR